MRDVYPATDRPGHRTHTSYHEFILRAKLRITVIIIIINHSFKD